MDRARIIRTGWMTKRGQVNKNWKRRYFVLRADLTLSYYRNTAISLKPKGVIQISKECIVQYETPKLLEKSWPSASAIAARWAISLPSRNYYFFCDKAEVASAWVGIVRSLVENGAVDEAPDEDAAAADLKPAASDASTEASPESLAEIQAMCKLEENKICADCDCTGSGWVSWNIGAFICIKCAGVHRGLGTHISKVRSASLDTWSPLQVECVRGKGNKQNKLKFESSLPSSFVRPHDGHDLEVFIRNKYVKRLYSEELTSPLVTRPSVGSFADVSSSRRSSTFSTSTSTSTSVLASPLVKQMSNPFDGMTSDFFPQDTRASAFSQPATPKRGTSMTGEAIFAGDPMDQHPWG